MKETNEMRELMNHLLDVMSENGSKRAMCYKNYLKLDKSLQNLFGNLVMENIENVSDNTLEHLTLFFEHVDKLTNELYIQEKGE